MKSQWSADKSTHLFIINSINNWNDL